MKRSRIVGSALGIALAAVGTQTLPAEAASHGRVQEVRSASPLDDGSGTYDDFSRYLAAENAKAFAMTPGILPADCTYFVSLSLWDGAGLPESPEWTHYSADQSLWGSHFLLPGVTRAAINANDFVNYMTESGRAQLSYIEWSDNTAGGAQLGDVIAYDWENGSDGIIDHVAIVTGFNADGYPLVSQHTPNQLDRFWSWSELSNDWIEYAMPGAQAYLLHIER